MDGNVSQGEGIADGERLYRGLRDLCSSLLVVLFQHRTILLFLISSVGYLIFTINIISRPCKRNDQYMRTLKLGGRLVVSRLILKAKVSMTTTN